MLDSSHLSSVKPEQTSGRTNLLQQHHISIISVDIQWCSRGVPLSKKVNCSGRSTRKSLDYWSLSQKYRETSPIQNERKLYGKNCVLPYYCLAQFTKVAEIGWKSSRIVAQASSTLRETADEEDTCLDSNGSAAVAGPSDTSPSQGRRTFDRANTVGILGGLAPRATVDFMKKILDATNPEDESDHIPVVLCSDPYLRKKIGPSLVRARAIGSASHAEASAEVELLSLEPLLENRRFLEQSGAKCIVMPCHMSHLWYDRLAEGCSVPFLDMAHCVVEELKAADLRPLEAGSRPKIGVLGTEATLATDFYQEKLRSQGFDVALPDKPTMEHAVIPGIAALHRRDMEGARNLLRIAVQVLLVNAANMVILACHSTPTAFSADDPVLRKCIDPTDALVRATIKWSRSTKGIRT